MSDINTDLRRERDNCTFELTELTNVIDGGQEKTRERKEREDLLLTVQDVYQGTPEYYLGSKELYERSIRNSVAVFSVVRRLQEEGKMVIKNYRDLICNLLSASALPDGSPLGLHYIMFMPAIMSQGDEEQQAYWLGRAWNCSIIGSFAQTELGHGTFIRGLETTATYDPSTKEFVLHSPTLSSYKWWPGGLGHTANYCIVVAQLYTKGECHGIHPFMVQVRDEETHEPMLGIKIGEIGSKMGLNGVNNGFLGFDHVRIPRTHMFMKHAKVLEDGTYVKSRHSKLTYGAMVFVRVVIVFDMVKDLAKAVTIATRYSAVRRQCQKKEGEPESQILDYVTQQHKLFVAISTSHALRVTANMLWDTFSSVNEELTEGNLERLPELHALACCLKATSTSDASANVERCRLACGGHGYMQSSSLPLIAAQVTAACTYEGDNTVLYLQTARFLLKTWQHVEQGLEMTPTVAYLRKASEPGFAHPWKNTIDGITRGFQVVAMRKISTCMKNLKNRVSNGLCYEDAWNMTSVQLVATAEAHCRAIIISTYYSETLRIAAECTPALSAVLHQLMELYIIYWALQRLNDLLLYTTISEQDVHELQSRQEDLLRQIRPNAVGLVDAFDFRDNALQSTLGAYDGRVYERLMEEALKSPLNAEPVNQSFHKHLKPFMQGKL